MKIISLSSAFVLSLLYVQGFAQSPATVDVPETNTTATTIPRAEWIYRETTDLMTDNISQSVTLKSSEYTSRSGRTLDVSLIFRCTNNKKMAGYFAFDHYMGYSGDNHSVFLRIDDGKATRQYLDIASGNESLGVWNTRRARKFSDIVNNAEKMAVQFEPSGLGQYQVLFTFPENKTDFEAIRSACAKKKQ